MPAAGVQPEHLNTGRSAASNLGPTAEFLKLKSQADEMISQGPPEGQSRQSLAAKERVMEAIRLYNLAEMLETNDNECKLLCQRELVKAYQHMGTVAGSKQLQLYFFD